MGLGLEGAYGAAGAADALRQLIRDRFERQQVLHAQGVEDQRLQLDSRRLDQNDQYRNDALAENKRLHDQTDADRIFKETQTLNESIPAGTEIAGTSPIVGRLQALGALKPRGIDAGTPASLAATPGALDDLPDTIANAPAPGRRTFLKQATAKQVTDEANRQDKLVDNARQAKSADAAIQARIDTLNQAADRMKMQGEVNAANILRMQAEAELAHSRAAATDKKGSSAPLSAGGKAARAAIEQAGPMTDDVLNLIRKEAPDIETNPQKYNSAGSKLGSLYQTAKYKAGFYDATDPRQQLVKLLQPVQGGQYMRSSRSRQMLDLVLQHMADPTQTLLTQYQRAKELKSIMPEMLEGIVRSEQPVDASNPLAGSYFDPNKGGGGGAAAGAPKVGDRKTFPNGKSAVFDGQGWVQQ